MGIVKERVKVEFNWLGREVVSLMSKSDVLNDIKNSSITKGEFIMLGVVYNFTIMWDKSSIDIWCNGNVISTVNNFTISFNQMY